MKSLKISFILFVLLLSVKISKADVKDTMGVFMTMENETIYMYGKASIDGMFLEYHDAKDKEHRYAMRKMKWMIVGNRVFCAFPLRKGDHQYRLQEIVAMNKKYILMAFWQTDTWLYIYDYESNLVEGKIRIYEFGSSSKKRNRKVYEQISPYFSSCKELLKKFENNLDNGQLFIKDIFVEQCDGAPSIADYIATYKDKRMESEK